MFLLQNRDVSAIGCDVLTLPQATSNFAVHLAEALEERGLRSAFAAPRRRRLLVNTLVGCHTQASHAAAKADNGG